MNLNNKNSQKSLLCAGLFLYQSQEARREPKEVANTEEEKKGFFMCFVYWYQVWKK